MMVTVVALFAACWAPFHVVHMLVEYSECWSPPSPLPRTEPCIWEMCCYARGPSSTKC